MPVITTSLMAGITFERARSSAKVGPTLPPDRLAIFSTTGSGALPFLPHSATYSVMRFFSVSSSTSRTMPSRPMPVSGLPSPVVT